MASINRWVEADSAAGLQNPAASCSDQSLSGWDGCRHATNVVFRQERTFLFVSVEERSARIEKQLFMNVKLRIPGKTERIYK